MEPFYKQINDLTELLPYLGGEKYYLLLDKSRYYAKKENALENKKFTDDGFEIVVKRDTRQSLDDLNTS